MFTVLLAMSSSLSIKCGGSSAKSLLLRGNPATTRPRYWSPAAQIFNQAYHQLEAIAHFRAHQSNPSNSLWWVVKHIKDPPNSAILTNYLRLFYDGGSRGNPGPGGSGWMLLEKRSREWYPIRAGWLSLQAPCSNNTAEIQALCAGLSEAVKHTNTKQTQIMVIGDSQFVQRLLLTQYRSKKFHHQTQAVHQLLSGFLQIAILHTRRRWNTAADYLANHAMDTRTSGTLSEVHLQQAPYQELLRNDSLFESTKLQSSRSLGGPFHFS